MVAEVVSWIVFRQPIDHSLKKVVASAGVDFALLVSTFEFLLTINVLDVENGCNGGGLLMLLVTFALGFLLLLPLEILEPQAE